MGVGDSLYEKIDSGITACKVVISCVTEKYALSLNCRREVSLANGRNKTIIPLLLERLSWPPSGPMSMVLTQLAYLDFSQQSKLTEGDSFSLLLIRLLQLDVVKHGKVGRNVANLTTTVKAYGQFKKPSKKIKPNIPPKKHEPASSRTCNIL